MWEHKQVGSFRFVHFSHVKRQGNKPAHILAQFAKQIGDLVVWLEETPNLIELVCAQDVAPLIWLMNNTPHGFSIQKKKKKKNYT